MRVVFSISILLIYSFSSVSSITGRNTISNHHAMQHRTCKTPGCIKAARNLSENIDTTIDPCDNFYRFVCGSYIREHTNSSSITDTVTSQVNSKIKNAIGNEIGENDSRTLRLLQSHYNTCLDNVQHPTRYGERSVKTLLNIVSKLGGWPVLVGESWDKAAFEWKNFIYQLRRIGYAGPMNSLLTIGIAVDDKNNTKHLVWLDQARTGLEYEYLVKGLGNEAVQAYYKYMVDIAKLLGVDKHRAKKELLGSLLFEIQLAQISSPAEERRNKSQLYNPMTVEELQSKYPGIPWKEYINEFLRPHSVIGPTEYVNVANPNYLKSITELIAKTPKRVLANYIFWQMIEESTPYLTKRTRRAREEFIATVTGNKKDHDCVSYVSDNLPLAVGALYVRKIFNANLKKEGEELVEDLRNSFRNSLEKADWMDAQTKKQAIYKLKSIHPIVGYPDEMLDDDKLDEYYKNLKEFPNSYLDSYLSINLFYLDYNVRNFRKSHNKTDWIANGIPMAEFNAFYKPTDNSIIIPAGFFQEETFALDRPNYMNYARLGSVIGHELTHAFDDQGSQYNEEGELINWWDRKTQKEYQKRAQCIIDQYSNYTVEEIDMNINGIITQGENIADNGGYKQAYFAYEEYEKQHGPEPRLPGLPYSSRQLFWISHANLWCENLEPKQLMDSIISDPHSPAEFRVMGTFSNIPEFARDFECPLGSPMNPVKKCTVW